MDGQATTNGTHVSQWESSLGFCICKLIQNAKRVPIEFQKRAAQFRFWLACERVGSRFKTDMTNSAVETSQQAFGLLHKQKIYPFHVLADRR